MDVQIVNGVIEAVGAAGESELPPNVGESLTLDKGTWVALMAEHEGLQAQVRDLRRQASVREQRWDSIVYDAHDWADENSLCSVFDDFCRTHGLPVREREYALTVDVVLRISLTEKASSDGEAEESVDRDRLNAYLHSMSQGELADALTSFDVTDVEEV